MYSECFQSNLTFTIIPGFLDTKVLTPCTYKQCDYFHRYIYSHFIFMKNNIKKSKIPGDSRFSCLHSSPSDSWTLQIRYTQLRDMGEYQCQVNTEPKISMSVFLHVTGIAIITVLVSIHRDNLHGLSPLLVGIGWCCDGNNSIICYLITGAHACT